MNEKLKPKVELYQSKLDQQKGLLAKGEALSAEDMVTVATLDTELETLQTEIKGLQAVDGAQSKLADRDAFLNQPGTNSATFAGKCGPQTVYFQSAGETQLSRQKSGGLFVESVGEGMLSDRTFKAIGAKEYKNDFWSYVRQSKDQLSAAQFKTLQEGIDDSGGYTLPEDFLNNVLMKRPTPTRVQNYVQSFNTTRDALTIPKVNYSTDNLYPTGIRATFTGEIPASSTASRVTDPVWGQLKIPVWTAMLSIPVTNDLIEDSAVNLQAWLEDRFAETIELLFDNMLLNGTGVNQPSGILMNPGGTDQPGIVVSGAAAAVTADGINNLAWSLPEQYDEDARFVMNKTNCGRQVAELKDGEGRYLWGSGAQESGLGMSARSVDIRRNRELAGYEVDFSGFMPNIAANAYPIVFGDFRGAALVRRIGFSIQVLRELYAETNQILLLGRVRFGAAVVEPWRLYAQQIHT